MVRFIGKCGACKQHSARDYSEFQAITIGTGMFKRQGKQYGRQIGAFWVPAVQDHACPRCNAPRWGGRRVQGFTTDHVCDARCTEAKGFQCECACGGKNHGQGLLVCT